MVDVAKELRKYQTLNKDIDEGQDPDKHSKNLGEEHCKLWNHTSGFGKLEWNPYNRLTTTINGVEYIFTPDSITNCYIQSKRRVKGDTLTESEKVRSFGNEVASLIKDYEDTDYTIGSSLLFPISIDGKSLHWTMNRARGISYKVHDRIDYTLECIKRYYDKNDDNPLKKAIERSKEFFDLFSCFKDYAEFFFFDDFIAEEGNVISFTGDIDFDNPFPNTKEKYIEYIKNTMLYILKRNKRIEDYLSNNK